MTDQAEAVAAIFFWTFLLISVASGLVFKRMVKNDHGFNRRDDAHVWTFSVMVACFFTAMVLAAFPVWEAYGLTVTVKQN